jgi:glucose-6-phosphate dehydrogenase assembly protein OpcA
LNSAAASINPEKVLRDWRELWAQLAKNQGGSGGVLRACSMTLLVVAEHDAAADTESVRKSIGQLMHRHPSRAIVLIPREGGELSGRVFAECWMPFGAQQQICSEGIEITADPEQTDEVARAIVPLIAPDLPAVLWCRGPRAFLDRSLDPLFPLANKIVFNTRAVRHPSSAIEFLRRMHKSGQRVADLAWTRLTGWREAVAHMMDAAPPAASISTVRIEYGGDRPGTRALYFARWIERALPRVSITLAPLGREPGLQSVVFTGENGEMSIRRAEASSLEVGIGTRTYSAHLPPDSEECLMREELSISGRDPAFEGVLA